MPREEFPPLPSWSSSRAQGTTGRSASVANSLRTAIATNSPRHISGCRLRDLKGVHRCEQRTPEFCGQDKRAQVCEDHSCSACESSRQPQLDAGSTFHSCAENSTEGLGDRGAFRCLFWIARPMSGRNSLTTPNPMSLAMVMPKLTAPSPREL